ncbi:MAG: hypothetical protein JNN27_09585 [Planctomycetes bacterium]|nr:hypothetical protein [Planctomycetota bacterium]
MGRFLAGILALVAVGAVVLVLWRVTRAPAEVRADVDRPAATANGARELAPASQPPTLEEREASPAALQAPEFEAQPELAPVGDESQLELQLVDALTHAPLAAASVVVWDARAASRSELLRVVQREGDLARVAALAADVEALPADNEGRVAFARPAVGAYVFAQAPGYWGAALLEFDEPSPRVVELQRDYDVEALVLDSAGAPLAGARVEVLELAHEVELVTYAYSDATGRARLAHLGALLADRAAPLASYSIGLSSAFAPRVEASLDPDAPPQAQIVLRAPPSGVLEVRLFDANEIASTFVQQIELRVAQVGLSSELGAQSVDPAFATWTARAVVDGIARFEAVPLDAQFELRARLEGSDIDALATVRGPSSPGEALAVQLPVGARGALLAGRLRASGGAPLAHERVTLEVVAPHEPQTVLARLAPRTDSDGRFVVELDLRFDPSGMEAVVRGLEGSLHQSSSARVLIPPLGNAPSLDLGELELRPAPKFAAGRVVDASGRGQAGAELELRGRSVGEAWQRLGVQARSGPDGRFELTGEFDDLELEVRAATRRASSAFEYVRRAGDSLELRLTPHGAIAGRVELDASLPRQAFEMYASARGDDVWIGAPLSSDGTFVLNGLPAGEYQLSLGVAGESAAPELFGVTRTVQVAAGARTRDPRLEPLDLRSRARFAELEFVDTDGRRALGFELSLEPQLPRALSWAPRPDVWSFCWSGEPFDVWVRGREWAGQLVTEVSESRVVVLEPAPRTRLTIRATPGEFELPLGWVTARVTPLSAGEFAAQAAVEVTFDDAGVADAPLGWRGSTRVELTLKGWDSAAQRSAPLGTHVVELAPGEDPPTKLLQVSASSVAAAFAALGF